MTAVWHVCTESGCPEATDHASRRCSAHRLQRSPSSTATSAPGWRKLRAEVLERDGYECQLHLPGCTSDATCVDHREGLAFGGGHGVDNLQAACQPCNNAKRGRPPLKREQR
jgi:5-methylcytosine-specific restriction endonuclease McrA